MSPHVSLGHPLRPTVRYVFLRAILWQVLSMDVMADFVIEDFREGEVYAHVGGRLPIGPLLGDIVHE
jgi:hypothetical protein